jgi:hypothetical protein
MVGGPQQDIDRGEQIAGRFSTSINRWIFLESSHMTTPDLGSAGFHWGSGPEKMQTWVTWPGQDLGHSLALLCLLVNIRLRPIWN